MWIQIWLELHDAVALALGERTRCERQNDRDQRQDGDGNRRVFQCLAHACLQVATGFQPAGFG